MSKDDGMKRSYWLLTALSVLLLNGCATPTARTANNYIHKQSITSTGNYPAKNPQQVAVFQSDQSPQSAYKVIGVAKVSKFNRFGMQRPDATMHTMMKKLAASIGGDGLMNLSTAGNDEWQANVIQYQKILI